jgi:hypothetical protein
MSLVYEALQKAEREKQRKAGIVPPPSPAREVRPVPVENPRQQTEPPPATVAPARAYQPFLVSLVVCVSVVALVAIVYLVAAATRPGTSPVVTDTTAAAAPAPAVTAPAAPAPVTTDPPAALPPLNPMDARFRLTGIMRNPEGKFGAVINGKVVYDEYYVDGATVKSISHDRVILDIGGRETVVRLY